MLLDKYVLEWAKLHFYVIVVLKAFEGFSLQVIVAFFVTNDRDLLFKLNELNSIQQTWNYFVL